jgi:uroporphyrinogen-III synthase
LRDQFCEPAADDLSQTRCRLLTDVIADSYVQQLCRIGIERGRIHCIPVLQVSPTGTPADLATKVEVLEPLLDSVVLTSRHAAAALAGACLSSKAAASRLRELGDLGNVFAVGRTCARPIEDLGVPVSGVESGSAAVLAERVLARLSSPSAGSATGPADECGRGTSASAATRASSRCRRVLYPCGRSRRPEMERVLSSHAGVDIDATEVYETTPPATQDLHRAVQQAVVRENRPSHASRASSSGSSGVGCVGSASDAMPCDDACPLSVVLVFFSPRGAAAAFRTEAVRLMVSGTHEGITAAACVALGGTTGAEIERLMAEACGPGSSCVASLAMATEPTASGVAQCVKALM